MCKFCDKQCILADKVEAVHLSIVTCAAELTGVRNMYASSSPLSSANVFSGKSYTQQFDSLRNVTGSFVTEYDDEIYWLVFFIT